MFGTQLRYNAGSSTLPPAPTPASGPASGPSAAPSPLPAAGQPPSVSGYSDPPARFRNPQEMEAYYANLARTPYGPPGPKFARVFTVFTWGLGAFTVGYMVLFADFGKKEHVFQPVRREFAKLTAGWSTLSDSERDMLGLKKDEEGKPKGPSA